MQTITEKYFLHTSVFLRHASGASGEAEEQIEMILTKAVVAKHRVWMSSILFAELRPSVFIPGRFATLLELTHYFRSLPTFVTPDPNIMLRAARLRDVKWQRPQEPISLGDAIQIASALWVKEALGVLRPPLEPDAQLVTVGEGGRLPSTAIAPIARPTWTARCRVRCVSFCTPNTCANFNNESRSDTLVWVALCNSVAGTRLPFRAL